MTSKSLSSTINSESTWRLRLLWLPELAFACVDGRRDSCRDGRHETNSIEDETIKSSIAEDAAASGVEIERNKRFIGGILCMMIYESPDANILPKFIIHPS